MSTGIHDFSSPSMQLMRRSPRPLLDAASHQHLRASIALLLNLNQNPIAATENDHTTYITENSVPIPVGRSLSLQREIAISKIFAFVAAITDDPRKVAALSIEEYPKTDSLTLKLAANRGGLNQLMRGLSLVAEILQVIAIRGSCLAKSTLKSAPMVQLRFNGSLQIRMSLNIDDRFCALR